MKEWQYLFANRILRRGRSYYTQGRVSNVHLDQQGDFSADVKGSKIYHVTGNYREEQASALQCNCPYAADGNYCKHMAAALYRVEPEAKRNEQRKTPMQRLGEFLGSRYDHPELVINPATLLGGQRFPQKFVPILKQAVSHLEIIVEKMEDNSNPYAELDDGEWQYTLTAIAMHNQFSYQLIFDREQIIERKLLYTLTNSPRERALAKLVTMVQLANYLLDHNVGEASTETAYQVLDYYQQTSQSAEQTPVIQAFVEDHRGIYDDDATPTLYFRAGVPEHMYKFQNITLLVRLVKRGEPVNLGKYFDQVIIPEQLDQSSQVWLGLMTRLAEIRELSGNAYSTDEGINNRLSVEGEIADELDQALQDGGQAYSNRMRLYPLERSEKQLQPRFFIEPHGESNDPQRYLTVSLGLPTNLIRGRNAYYDLNFNRWQVIADPQLRHLGALFNVEKGVQFGTDTMAEFYHRVLPKIAKQAEIKVEGNRDLDSFVPPLLEPMYLLDYQNEVVICRLGIKQGAHEAFLFGKDAPNISERLLKQMTTQVSQYFSECDPPTHTHLLPVTEADELLSSGVDQLRKSGIVKATPAFKRLLNKSVSHFTVNVRINSHLLDLKVDTDGLNLEEIQQLLSEYSSHRKYYRLSKDRLVKVQPSELAELWRLVAELGIPTTELANDRVKLPLYRALYLDRLLAKRQSINYQTTADFKHLVERVQKPAQAKVPQTLKASLRPYQEEGFSWLTTLAQYGFGGLLADEMGLGKTLQMISLILANHQEGPSIVIAPAAVIYNWQSEFAKFAPKLKTQVIDGTKAERREQFSTAYKNADVIISSYDSFKRDIELCQGCHFNNEIIDEAQYIKNPQTAAAKAVKTIDAAHRFALTGTPIENQLSELWSIFDYLMPGFLSNYSQFKKNFETPIVKHHDQEAEEELKQLIQPFILRRLKKDVLQSLPEKTEEVVYAPLVGKQAKLYQARAINLLKRLQKQDDEEFKNARFEILAEITRLRQLCCSPQLLDDNYRGKSGKVEQTLELVGDELVAGHKILLFSQFTSTLAILKVSVRFS